MSSSFIKFKDKTIGFWVKDGLMQTVASYLHKTIEAREKREWLVKLNELIYENSVGTYPGWMHFDLDEFLIDDNQTNQFLEILEETKKMLKSKGEFISTEELNSFVVDPYLQGKWTEPAKTAYFIKCLDMLESLIKGEIKTRSDDPIDYW